ncbi:hypothetical protein EHM69_05610 [candidate division KSB1 bacterium]|nr:MAG: hypothetical protein EHM69_05610 [candidate division KSB1 bacterium]
MKCIIVWLCFMMALGNCAWAEPIAESPVDTQAVAEESLKPEAPAETPENSAPDELSTELNGIDTLDVLPSDVVTSYGGGTRRVHLEHTVFRREPPVYYEAVGRRDPFRALIVDEKKEGEIETDLLRVEGASLKGVVWSDGQYLALLKDKDGKSFVLREGDLIFHGRVLSVTQSQATFEVSEFGDYDQITLKVKG